MRDYQTMHILIVSDSPLFASGLKQIIDEAPSSVTTTVCDEASVNEYFVQFVPNVVIFDRPNASARGLEHYLEYMDKSVKVVVIGRDDDQIVVYSHRVLQEATVENLIKAITENSSN